MELDCSICGLCCFAGKENYGNKGIEEHFGITIGSNGWCVQYNKDIGCLIYDDRPEVCKILEVGKESCLLMRKIGIEKKARNE